MTPNRAPIQVVLVGVLTPLLTTEARQLQVRPVTVTITVTGPDGSPLAEAPIQSATRSGVSIGFTDASGQVVVSIDATLEETVLTARLWDGMWHELASAQRGMAEQRCHGLRNQFSFEPIYRVPLVANQDVYALSIAAAPAVRVRGRLVDASGQSVAGSIGSTDRLAFDDVELGDAGQFEFGGIERGAAVRLLAQCSTQVHPIELAAAQTLADVDLDDVVLTDAPADAPVRVTMQNQEYLADSALRAVGLAASFVSTDGTRAIGFPADLGGEVVRELLYTPARAPLLPAGEYYVVPGHFGTRSGLALYLSVLGGRQAALDAVGVPKITAISGQETTLVLDARAAYDAVVLAGGDLVE